MTRQPIYRETLTHSPDAVVWMRELREISQRKLAKLLGISQGYLSDIESGRRSAPSITLIRMSEIFGCPVAFLQAKPPMRPIEDHGDVPWAS